MDDLVLHKGGCHCGRVRWQARAPVSIVAWKCNCSDCSMRGNIHFIVPACNFQLQEECREWLTTYTFGTHKAKHIFCKICGITSYYIPRSNPDGIGVTVNCVDAGTIKHVEFKDYDGKNWDESYEKSGIESLSKVNPNNWLVDKVEKALPYDYGIDFRHISCRLLDMALLGVTQLSTVWIWMFSLVWVLTLANMVWVILVLNWKFMEFMY